MLCDFLHYLVLLNGLVSMCACCWDGFFSLYLLGLFALLCEKIVYVCSLYDLSMVFAIMSFMLIFLTSITRSCYGVNQWSSVFLDSIHVICCPSISCVPSFFSAVHFSVSCLLYFVWVSTLLKCFTIGWTCSDLQESDCHTRNDGGVKAACWPHRHNCYLFLTG